MADVKDFLNPTSMLTPGIAGGLAVSMSMPLAVNFNLSFKWIVLIVSFLLSFVVVLSFENIKSGALKGLYIVLNTMVIFSVGIGAGVTVDPPPIPPSQNVLSENANNSNTKMWRIINSFFVSSAYADHTIVTETNENQSDIEEKSNNHEDDEIEKLKLELLQAQEEAKREKKLRQEQEQKIIQYNQKRADYDKRWSW